MSTSFSRRAMSRAALDIAKLELDAEGSPMCRQDLDRRRRPRRAHHLQAPSQATSRRPNACGVRLSSSSECCVSSKVPEGAPASSGVCPSSSLACASARSSSRLSPVVKYRALSIVVDVRTARKQAPLGQSGYMTRKRRYSRHRGREKENDQGEGSSYHQGSFYDVGTASRVRRRARRQRCRRLQAPPRLLA